MPGLSSQQKSTVLQFVGFTQVDKRVAERMLKLHNWNIQQAVDGYFSGSSGSPQAPPATDRNAPALNKLFDKYRDSPQDNPDLISINGTMTYLQDLHLAIDSIGVLVLSDLVASPTLGEITRAGFLAGWSAHPAATTLTAQRTALSSLVSSLASETSRAPGGLFRRTYKHTFKLACPTGSKSVPLEMACEYWKLLFGPQGAEWKGNTSSAGGNDIPWLEWWLWFLENKWKKAVNKDLWEQTAVFEEKVRGDESLSWWSEDSAWPGVIDDFVEWAKREKGVGRRGDGGGAMEVE